ncbi:acyclic terpene utilization AtuA family protein [Xanthobacter autotrophicus]|uniref:acyclic terpene utilization AtuA family protein n=1 Tax=Xanthobacter autotrophicus TaxID=280 RepID=UPI00372C9BB8
MKDIVRLGAGSGFWGDAADPAIELLEAGELDYMGFDYLAELTMALLERQRQKDHTLGYVPDAVDLLTAMMRSARDRGTRLISNGGGVNPQAAAAKLLERARADGMGGLKIASVSGDSVVSRLAEFRAAGVPLAHFETGDDGFATIKDRVVSASVYVDASGIVDALDAQADIVITGRVSDNAPYVGALMHEFGWRHDDAHADRIGAAITVGHLVECAAGCTGGMSSRFAEMPAMGRAGFPIVEFARDATATVTKLPGTGGRVDAFTVKEHLLYEIGDPSNYMMPDGTADFTTLHLEEAGTDRVRLSNMSGKPRSQTWKLMIGYMDGWIGEGLLFFPWPDALGRARKAKASLLERFERLGLMADDIHFDFIGVDMLHGPAAPEPASDLNEVGLRVAVKTKTRDEAEKVRRACSNLWIMGPGGTSFGAPLKPRPVIAAWPTLVPRELIAQTIDLMVA